MTILWRVYPHPYVILPTHTRNLLIADDRMNDASNNLELHTLFTKYVHHRSLSCMYLVQNLFMQGKASRTISLNTNYTVLFKNPRDKYQITLIARQMFSCKTTFFWSRLMIQRAYPMDTCLWTLKPRPPTF